MKPRVYLDTSVISYLTAKPGRDAVAVARQIVTIEWWAQAEARFELVISDFVIEEASQGDPAAVERRLAALRGIAGVAVDAPEVEALASALIQNKALPASARFDALHIAAAACNGIDFLATWNYKHLANPVQLNFVEQVCAQAGYQAARIVTPDQFLSPEPGDDHVE